MEAAYATPKDDCRSSGMPLQGMSSWRIILSCIHLKNSKCMKQLSLNSPHLLEDRASRKNSIVTESLPRV